MLEKEKNDSLLFVNKLIAKVPDPRNTKRALWIVFKKEKQKINKTIKNNYLSTKNFSNPKQCWYNISYYRTPKNCTKADSKSSLYSDTKKSEKFLNVKNVKITNRAHAFRGYTRTYNVEILNSLDPELQLKNWNYNFQLESAIKVNRIIDSIKGKWLQRDSNPQPLSLQTNIQPFSQTGQMIELRCE